MTKESSENDFDATQDPTNGLLEATIFPPDDMPDPDQTPEDQGVEDE